MRRAVVLLALVGASLVTSTASAHAADGDLGPDLPGPAILAREGAAFASSFRVAVSCTPAGSTTPCTQLARYGHDGTHERTGSGAATLRVTRLIDAGSGNVLALGHQGVARFLTDDSVDTAFGTGGVVAFEGFAQSAAVAPDGSIYVGSTSGSAFCQGPHAEVRRYRPDGTLDTAFGTGGTVKIDLHYADVPSDLVADASGVFVGVGTTSNPTASGSACALGSSDAGGFIARYDAAGQPDMSFGYLGASPLSTIRTGSGWASGVGLVRAPGLGILNQPKVPDLVAAHGNEVVRMSTSGLIQRRTHLGPMLANSVALDQRERIIVGGDHTQRLWPDLRADTAFGTCGTTRVAGRVDVDPASPRADVVSVQASGQSVVLGSGTVRPIRTSNGAWLASPDGGVFTSGDALYCGSAGDIRLNQPIVGVAAATNGNGYWLVARDGGIFSFGHATFRGSTGSMRLNQPIVGMAAAPSTDGYWLVASDGGIFSFDAPFYGSTGALRLNRPIVGMAPTPSGRGYWMVASDGGIFSFGDAAFFGSTGAIRLNQPIVAMAPTPSGNGYFLLAADGGVFNFGDAHFFGSAVGSVGRAVGIVPVSNDFYWVYGSDGRSVYLGPGGTRVESSPAVRPASPFVSAAGT
jgi:hypothetical protein